MGATSERSGPDGLRTSVSVKGCAFVVRGPTESLERRGGHTRATFVCGVLIRPCRLALSCLWHLGVSCVFAPPAHPRGLSSPRGSYWNSVVFGLRHAFSPHSGTHRTHEHTRTVCNRPGASRAVSETASGHMGCTCSASHSSHNLRESCSASCT